MKQLYFIIFLLSAMAGLFAQTDSVKLLWNAEIHSFFDNTEYAKSSLTIPQTMSGVNLLPELGFSWNKEHSIFGGVNLLKKTGSSNVIDKANLIAYYHYSRDFSNFTSDFYAGIFPRRDLLDNYSDFFFQDSISYFVPALQGLFWKLSNQNSFFNIWLDWNGGQSETVHETFFVGASGYKKIGLFFLDFQSYMFHLAATAIPDVNFHVSDNVLAQFSLGIEIDDLPASGSLLFSAGLLTGVERERNVEGHDFSPLGGVFRLKGELYGLGLDNRLYVGEERMRLYSQFGNRLYWGNPFLQSNYYLQSRLYWNVFNNKRIQAKLSSHFHYSEAKFMFEQLFVVRASLGNLK